MSSSALLCTAQNKYAMILVCWCELHSKQSTHSQHSLFLFFLSSSYSPSKSQSCMGHEIRWDPGHMTSTLQSSRLSSKVANHYQEARLVSLTAVGPYSSKLLPRGCSW